MEAVHNNPEIVCPNDFLLISLHFIISLFIGLLCEKNNRLNFLALKILNETFRFLSFRLIEPVSGFLMSKFSNFYHL